MKLIPSPDQLNDGELFTGDIIKLAEGDAAILCHRRLPDNTFAFFWRTTASVWINHPLPESVYPITLLYSHLEEVTK